jgi:hypothetical protein
LALPPASTLRATDQVPMFSIAYSSSLLDPARGPKWAYWGDAPASGGVADRVVSAFLSVIPDFFGVGVAVK